MKTIILSILFIFFSVPLISQSIKFQKNFGYFDWEYGMYVQQTSDSGYIIAGSTEITYGSSLKKCYIVKTNLEGDTKWSKVIDYFPIYSVNYVSQTNDGGHVVAGNYQTYNPNKLHAMIIRLNAQGDTLWTKSFDNMQQTDFLQTIDGGYLLAGRYLYQDTIVVIKTDTIGNIIWQKNYIADIYNVNNVIQTYDSCYVLSGNTGDWENYLFKISADGDSLWTKLIYASSPADDIYVSDIKQTSDSGFVITGYGLYNNWYVIGTFILKTDSIGNELWAKHYGDYNHQSEGYSIDTTKDGGYFISGINITTRGIFLMRTDVSGDSLWTISFDAIDENYMDEGRCVQATTDGGCVIAGRKYMGYLGKYDMYLIKIDSATTVNPLDTTGIIIASSETEGNISIFPNPCDGKFEIQIIDCRLQISKVEIVNVFGERIYESFINSYSSFVSIDLSNHPSGIYFIRIICLHKNFVRKITVFH